LRWKDITPEHIDLFEINEAFASVAILSMRELGVTAANVNVNGRAISTECPVGMSGAWIALHLAHELERRGSGVGGRAGRRRAGRGPGHPRRILTRQARPVRPARRGAAACRAAWNWPTTPPNRRSSRSGLGGRRLGVPIPYRRPSADGATVNSHLRAPRKLTPATTRSGSA
jgi:hypothetical protein